uniref:Uncharacterized protein n=1 Tax=Manihot esculenta TaxID=3983 RepID=A0A2C9VH87_MANES
MHFKFYSIKASVILTFFSCTFPRYQNIKPIKEIFY